MLRVVGEWDGWKSYPHTGDIMLFEKNDSTKWFDAFDYHTNISTLWPVAKRVVGELEYFRGQTFRYGDFKATRELTQLVDERTSYIKNANSTFDTLQLFGAVHSAITILNKYKNEPKI